MAENRDTRDDEEIGGDEQPVDMPAEGTPEISVAHASALFEVQVKNSGDSEINVTEIKLSNDAGKNMTGASSRTG